MRDCSVDIINERLFKYAAEMVSGGMICLLSPLETGSNIRVILWE
jgi:hypothetical protein